MTFVEFENLLHRADYMIARSDLRKAEYWRGFRSGIKFHFQNSMPESIPDHYFIMDAARRDGCHDVHNYARGYRDGCKGVKPEDTG